MKYYLTGLDKLDTLEMNHNQLTSLNAGDLEGMPRLSSLSLNYNKITHIDNEAFRGLEGNWTINYLAEPSFRDKSWT